MSVSRRHDPSQKSVQVVSLALRLSALISKLYLYIVCKQIHRWTSPNVIFLKFEKQFYLYKFKLLFAFITSLLNMIEVFHGIYKLKTGMVY